MKNLESEIQNTEIKPDERETPKEDWGYKIFGMFYRPIVLAVDTVFLLVALGCGDTGGGGGSSGSVNASLFANPQRGGQPVATLFDASATTAPKPINKYEFDFDGDGTPDYTETPGDASDGAFDGMTTANYPAPGEYPAEVTVTDEGGNVGTAAVTMYVGFEDELTDLVTHVMDTFTNASYTPTDNTGGSDSLHILDLRDFQNIVPVDYSYDVYGISFDGTDEVFVIYNWDDTLHQPILTADDYDIINAYNAEMEATGDPQRISILEHDDSPEEIADYVLSD